MSRCISSERAVLSGWMQATNCSGLYETGTTLKHWKMDCPKGRVAVFIGSFFTPSEVEKGTPTAAKIADMARDKILALGQMSEG